MTTSGTGREDEELRRRAKQTLRRQMRAVRETLPASACEQRSAKVAKHLATLEEFERARTVLAFSSIRNEVKTRSATETAWSKGKRVALPRVVGMELVLHLVEPETVLVEGAFAVPEPPEGAPPVAPADVDFALVPALAVDPRGYRIGYGGGYYDRLLPKLRHACVCAVGYGFQLVSEVPEQPFDVKVDLVVTDEQVIRTA